MHKAVLNCVNIIRMKRNFVLIRRNKNKCSHVLVFGQTARIKDFTEVSSGKTRFIIWQRG